MSQLRWSSLSDDATVRLVLVIAFILSRIIFAAAGVRFDSGGVDYYWQFLAPDWLRDALFTNLFYLHSQPPLFNFFVGLIEQFPRPYWTPIFHAAYLAIGLTMCLLIYRLCRLILSFGPIGAGVAAFGFSVSSQAILYENWLFYVYPATLFVTATTYFLVRYSHDQGASNLFGAVGAAALASFTWGLFHLVWFLGLAAIIFAMSRANPNARRVGLFSIVLAGLLIAGLYFKNYALYGFFGPSSWQGMNVAVMTHGLPQRSKGYPGLVKRLLDRNELSLASNYKPFSENVLDDPRFTQSLLFTDVALLSSLKKPGGQANYHHEAYIGFSKLLQRDAFAVIRHFPGIYVASIATGAFDTFFRPSSDYLELNRASKNRERIAWWDKFCHLLLLRNIGQAQIDNSLKSLGPTVNWGTAAYGQFIVILLALAFACARAVGAIRVIFRTSEVGEGTVWIAIAWIMMWVIVVPLAVNGIETNRIRFVIEPLIFVVFLQAARDWIWQPLQRRLAARPT